MQVEVNAENIVRYGLVQLTGNSVEKLMEAAKEAADNGYILTCRIPMPDDDIIDTNIFDAAGSTPVSDLEEHLDKGPIEFIDDNGHIVDVLGQRGLRVVDIVPGEVVDEEVHGPWNKENQRYEDGCKADERHQ